MTIRSSFFDAVSGDRTYNAEHLASVFDSLVGNGYVYGLENMLQVIENSPTGRSVKVRTGSMWVQGRLFEVYGSDEVVTLPENTSGTLQYIYLFVSLNLTARTITLSTTMTTATSLFPTRTETRWDMMLARVSVISGYTNVLQSDITDLRDNKFFCGRAKVLVDTVPSGAIIMWSGSVASVPPGYLLCNGSNGTPDLRGQFIVGAGGTLNPGATGGTNSNTLNVNQLPSHSHATTIANGGAHAHTASTGNAGSHAHSGTASSAGGHTHTGETTTNGSHIHVQKVVLTDTHDHSHQPGGTNFDAAAAPSDADSSDPRENVRTEASGDHKHLYTTDAAGAHEHALSVNIAGAHTHPVTVDVAAAHSHTATSALVGSGAPVENRPAYYALCYIMKA